MKEHRLKVHISRFKHRYSCTRCRVRLSNSKCLARHVTTKHLKLVTYPCNMCSNSFSTKSNLKRHIEESHELLHLSSSEEERGGGGTNVWRNWNERLMELIRRYLEEDQSSTLGLVSELEEEDRVRAWKLGVYGTTMGRTSSVNGIEEDWEEEQEVEREVDQETEGEWEEDQETEGEWEEDQETEGVWEEDQETEPVWEEDQDNERLWEEDQETEGVREEERASLDINDNSSPEQQGEGELGGEANLSSYEPVGSFKEVREGMERRLETQIYDHERRRNQNIDSLIGKFTNFCRENKASEEEIHRTMKILRDKKTIPGHMFTSSSSPVLPKVAHSSSSTTSEPRQPHPQPKVVDEAVQVEPEHLQMVASCNFKCAVCGKKVRDSFNLRRHMKDAHSEEKGPYFCLRFWHRTESFNTEWERNTHMKACKIYCKEPNCHQANVGMIWARAVVQHKKKHETFKKKLSQLEE